MGPQVGSRWGSPVSDVEVVVVRAPASVLDLTCAGAAMVPIAEKVNGSADPAPSNGTVVQLGKRYTDQSGELELLCTKGGKGSLSLGTEKLLVKQPKALPSSD